MKRIIISLAAAALVSLACGAAAAADYKIGFVNTERLFREATPAKRAQLKRIIYLSEGGGLVVEAAVILTPAPSQTEVTAGEVYITLHPLRHVPAGGSSSGGGSSGDAGGSGGHGGTT